MDTNKLNGEFDAAAWAEAFSERFGIVRRGKHAGEPVDDDLMVGWFANAIMAGYDHKSLLRDTTALGDTSPELIRQLDEMGGQWGPLGVALASARLTSREALLARIEAERWQEGVATAVCVFSGCDYDDIDERGPVFLRDDKTPHYACVEHWEGVHGVLGHQVNRDDEQRVSPSWHLGHSANTTKGDK